LRLLKPIVRLALLLLVAGYFVSAAVMLFTRYWVLPRLDQWRPAIEQVVSEAVGTPVEIGKIQARWRSLNAALVVSDIKILGSDGTPGLMIPSADAIVSWRSLFHFKPVFKYIGIDGFDLTVSRRGRTEYRAAGFEFDTGADSDSAMTDRLLDWLALQGRINFTNASLTWTDPYSNTPTVSITDLNLTLNNLLLTHELNAQASLPADLGKTVSLAVRSERTRGSIAGLVAQTVDTNIYVALPQVNLLRLSDWFDVPSAEGVLGGQAWMTLRGAQVDRLTIDVASRDTSGGDHNGDKLAWRADSAQIRMDGPAALFTDQTKPVSWFTKAPANSRLNVVLSTKNLTAQHLTADLDQLSITEGKLSGAIKQPREGALSLVVDSLSLANHDGVVALNGQWSREAVDSWGEMDFEGTLTRFNLASLPGYLSGVVGEDTQQWMNKAFKTGSVSKAGFKVKGSVQAFPYAGKSTAGIFNLDGVFEDLTLDYAPPEGLDELAWPLLVGGKGTLSMVNDRISIKATAGALRMPDEQQININRLTADIIDLDTTPILMLDTVTAGSAKGYTSALTKTALLALVPPFVTELSGTGQWSLPLTLQMNLEDTNAATFRAVLNLNGGSVGYVDVPPVTVTSGTAVFTETGFEAQGLTGTWLGGNLAVSGAINDSEHTLQAQGDLAWSALEKYTGSVILRDWFTGQMPYQMTLTAEPKKPIDVKIESTLVGTEITLPAPFGKARQATLPTTLHWKEGVAPGADTMGLRLGSLLDVQARLSPTTASARSAIIDAATITIGELSARQVDTKPNVGVSLVARLQQVDSEQWRSVAKTIQAEVQSPTKGRPLLGSLRSVDLSASSFKWDHVFLDAMDLKLALNPAGANSLTLKSEQTVGSIRWQSKAGKVDSRVVAHFTKLHVGDHKIKLTEDEKTAARSSLLKEDTLSEVPALALTIDEFTLYGSKLGRLEVIGENSPDHTEWRIEKLKISNPNGEINAAGTWHFSPDPGIKVAASFSVSDLGQMSNDLGAGDRMRKGSGMISAKVDWREFPWRSDYSALNAQVAIDLKDGVFDGVDSRGARVLELLSLQSLSRLFSINASPEGTFTDGFPWQSIRGDLSIKDGVVDTRNLGVNSSVAIISIIGGSNLVDETWQLDANVKPNLDLSGAAIATGFVVNPLMGLGALVGQYLLKIPVERALSVDYVVTGTWDDPLINGKSNDAQPKPNEKEPSVLAPSAAVKPAHVYKNRPDTEN
jgi:uncharacterized protein (TIGR02099 family)